MRNLKELSSEEHGIDIRDTKRILLGLAGVKVAYDGTNTQTRNIYDHVEGETRKHGGFFEGKKDTDIFIYAMCLGKRKGLYNDYEKKDGKIDRRATIDVEYFASQPEYVWMMIATAFDHAKNVDGMDSNQLLKLFDNPAKIVEICEKYANFGIHELMDMNDKASVGDPYRGYDEKLNELLDET